MLPFIETYMYERKQQQQEEPAALLLNSEAIYAIIVAIFLSKVVLLICQVKSCNTNKTENELEAKNCVKWGVKFTPLNPKYDP